MVSILEIRWDGMASMNEGIAKTMFWGGETLKNANGAQQLVDVI